MPPPPPPRRTDTFSNDSATNTLVLVVVCVCASFSNAIPHCWVQAPGIVRYTDRRLVRVLLAWTPRIMRLLGLKPPRKGLVLQVDGGDATIIRTLADPTGEKVWGVTSAVESNGKLFLGSLHSKGVAVLDLQKL